MSGLHLWLRAAVVLTAAIVVVLAISRGAECRRRRQD